MEKKTNYFGRTLERFLLTSNVKNYTVAKALNYDVSYISKWITAAALPSKKNAEQIISMIARTIAEQAALPHKEELCRLLGVSEEQLEEVISERLTEAYYAASGYTQQEKYFNNASFTVLPEGDFPMLAGFAEEIDREKPVSAAVLVDLFSLDHTAKLYLAGIDSHKFRIKEPSPSIHIRFILNLDTLRGDMVYDVILLIHLLTHYSLCDFHLSYSKSAAGKLMFAVENQYAGATILSDRRQFLCTTATRELKSVKEIYEAILMEQNPDQMIFFSTVMDDMLESHEYIRALLSRENKWLAGHITEHFLSPDLFKKIADSVWGQDNPVKKEGERAHTLALSAAALNGAELMIYDTALTNFVINGEVDFFNHKVILPPEERKAQLVYLRSLFTDAENLEVKMVRGGFSDDFKYITNPCMFLSEATDYLRLENGCYSNNLLLVKDKSLQHVFHTFFDEIWNNRPDVVISDKAVLLEKLDSLLDAADLLAGVEM